MKVNKKRRREYKTNYKSRIKILKSGKPRVVFRKTNIYVIGQYIESEEAQDKVLITVNSKQLLNYGWPLAKTKNTTKTSIKSLPACYLTGFLLGNKIAKKQAELKREETDKSDTSKQIIFDLGLQKNIPKSKQYAFLKGLIDAGIEIKNKAEFPKQDRITGMHLKQKINFKKIKNKLASSLHH